MSEKVSTSKTSSGGAVQEVVEFFKTLIWIVIAALILRGVVIEAFKIPSGSMKPTLKIGDHILVTKFNYALWTPIPFQKTSLYQYRTPKRSDIVVFTRVDDPTTSDDESDKNFIKRVIALPGETVEVRNRKVFINNQILAEDYARWDEGGVGGDFGPATVPENHIFLMGDNRDHSLDSRFWPNPFLPLDRVKGKALVVYWSWDRLSRMGTLIK